ncbi:MAG: glycosyltransferase family 2 protein [Peptococcaceae bacterium]|nr:glycosyltransferase family 2 protein [Peptococcaceae bacterium]
MSITNIVASVVVPIRNEEHYIKSCIESLLQQDYPAEQLEILLVDGGSTDKTCEIIQHYCAQQPHLHLLNNPDRTVPYALNMGIHAARGRFIVIMGAHSTYADDYISKCIECLEETGAENVGGVAQTRSQGFWGEAIALMQSTRFGVGNAAYRVGAKDGYVDTVPFGAFPRETFERFGCYDVRLTRNQDNEMNYRIRKNGGKNYLSNDIKFTYFCRDSISKLIKNGFQNGKWGIITSFLCPGSMSLRHFIPLLFVLSLLMLGLAVWLLPHPFWLYLLLAELGCYGSLDVAYALRVSVKSAFKYFLPLIILYPLFHISYGVGSLRGFLSPIGWGKNSGAGEGLVGPETGERKDAG